ncbi:serine/threonine-protein kinase [Nocardia brasiliensis]|uniref:non-specific serine/threonine protein kinase n=1 Tax=Nocardia brasiliensis (strain ATCC 700358 / HUJEG-1) TaxID=1133849 RepID=K0EZN4_NOCB7|nr:serine/threonine-protein kinase [Nocardia brasiliensis]AFU02350.1 serine/threonine protein kinase [Nocardia brasiliensis ATCC 700358]
MILQPGTRFAGFTIERVLGAGGMGTVYLARHPRMPRRVALKVLTESFHADRRTRSAFDREARLAAGLEHPNIVSVYDRSAADDPALWLAMRYIDGGDAAGLLSGQPDGLAPERVVRLLTDAAHALDYAHAQGVLHRDVKPANLLVENDARHGERAVLTDFGIARTLDDTVTLSGIAATFAYAAPERFSDAIADHRADVYSLGCTLFQLLTGQHPFPRKDQAAVIGAHLAAPPPAPRERRPELPAALDAVIATAMAKSPRDRYDSCTALAEATARALTLSDDAARSAPTAANGSARAVPAPGGEVVAVVRHGADRAAAVQRPERARSATPGGAKSWLRAGGSGKRRRVAVGAGVLVTGVGVVAGTVFTVRGDDAAPGRGTATSVVRQQTTSSPPAPTTTLAPATVAGTSVPLPADVPSPDDVAPPGDTLSPAQPAPPVQQRPQSQQQQAPPVVPQTRVHQWPG